MAVACLRVTDRNLACGVGQNLDSRVLGLGYCISLWHDHHRPGPPLLCVVLLAHLPRGSASAARMSCRQPGVGYLGRITSCQGVLTETPEAQAASGLRGV
jgi:hypothetical protein